MLYELFMTTVFTNHLVSRIHTERNILSWFLTPILNLTLLSIKMLLAISSIIPDKIDR